MDVHHMCARQLPILMLAVTTGCSRESPKIESISLRMFLNEQLPVEFVFCVDDLGAPEERGLGQAQPCKVVRRFAVSPGEAEHRDLFALLASTRAQPLVWPDPNELIEWAKPFPGPERMPDISPYYLFMIQRHATRLVQIAVTGSYGHFAAAVEVDGKVTQWQGQGFGKGDLLRIAVSADSASHLSAQPD
jgi:hypothetical protein